MKMIVPVALLLLSPPALAGAPLSPAVDGVAQSSAHAHDPTGQGDPYIVTCRPPQYLPGSRLKGPEVCKTNAVWAQYRKDGMDVAADGIHDVPSEKLRTINPPACHAATMGGGGTAAMIQTNFSQLCE